MHSVRSRIFTDNRMVAVFAAAILLPPLLGMSQFELDQFGGYFLLAVLAMSVDLMWGYGGLLVLGQALFFGGGGYGVAMLLTQTAGPLPLTLWPALGVGLVGILVLAALIGFFSFTSRGGSLGGAYLAMVTLVLAVAAELYARAGGELTGGVNGILLYANLEAPLIGSFQYGSSFYFFAAALMGLCYALLRAFTRSETGLALRAIRDNEQRVSLLGYDIAVVKRRAFILSGVVAAFAGAFYYLHQGIVTPEAVGSQQSISAVLWVALGGRGTLLGPILGAVLLGYLNSQVSGTLLDWWPIIIGAILIVVILFFSGGILGSLRNRRGLTFRGEGA